MRTVRKMIRVDKIVGGIYGEWCENLGTPNVKHTLHAKHIRNVTCENCGVHFTDCENCYDSVDLCVACLDKEVWHDETRKG